MMPILVAAEYRGRYRAWLRFADGAEGEVDLEDELWGTVFEPLRDERVFARLKVHPELHTLTWPNGADFAPEFLYRRLKGTIDSRRASRHRAAE
jgi:hypothetical protein